MSKSILKESEKLLKRLERVDKFVIRYNITPCQETKRILNEMQELADSIPDIKKPKNQDELIQAELKRRLKGESFTLEQVLTPGCYDFDTVVSMYSIPKSDINGLKGWLNTNRDKTLEAIERLYQTKEIQNYELGLRMDIPSIKRQAEEFAAVHVQKYHKILGKHLQELTKVGGFLRDINAVPTTEARSYFNPIAKTLAIGIPAVCFTTEDSNIQINERELITLYGHEGMGHALNQVITQTNGLPYFLTKDTPMVIATLESVAQFYQNVIFEDLKNSPETQKALGIKHKFEEIYQEAKDIAQLNNYRSKLFQYAITVLADKKLGAPQDSETVAKKIDLISELALDPKFPFNFVESNKYNFDSNGNLHPQLVSELRYCARPVQRALGEFAKQGFEYRGDARSKIDETLLKGFWTPIGFVDNARLKAQEEG